MFGNGLSGNTSEVHVRSAGNTGWGRVGGGTPVHRAGDSHCTVMECAAAWVVFRSLVMHRF